MIAAIASGAILSCDKKTPPVTPPPVDTTEHKIVTAIDSNNRLSDAEKEAGYELLFDGETLDGWKRFNHDTIGPLWSVKDGVIICDGTGLTEGTANVGGSLTTIRKFENFDLTVDWKLSPGGNSGILYHVVEDKKYHSDYETGPEYQVMDDNGWKGEKLREVQKAGGSYDMFAAPTTKKVKPVGEWNTSRIIYNKGHVEHYLNGEKVVEFDENSPEFKAAYKKSKWTGYKDWNKSKKGAISLQDHGAAVYFRNLKIKSL